jgi:hypothetical protein
MEMTANVPAWKIAMIAIAGLILPACGKGTTVPAALFTEGFNGPFPGTSWTAPTGSATAAKDGSNGFPAASLKMTTTTASTSVRTDSFLGFSTPDLTISVHMAASSGGATELGTGTVSIVNTVGPTVVATATWDNATNKVTFHIDGGAADAQATVTRDLTFYRLVFNVNSAGTATWSFNNGAPLVTQPLFPTSTVFVRLGADFATGTAWPLFFFDNVNVTSP